MLERIEATPDEIPLSVRYPWTSVSVELKNPPAGETSELRVATWLADHKALIVAAEKRWRVDRRAIAGAIAWEALENVRSTDAIPGTRFSGPGKVHYRSNHFSEGVPVAKEVEDRGALPKRTQEARRQRLAKPDGAVEYIGAIMRAFADEGRKAGYDLYRDPAMLTTFYNAWDLAGVKGLFEKKKHPAPLSPNEEMGTWVRDHLAYLEGAVGAPPKDLAPPAPKVERPAKNKGPRKGGRPRAAQPRVQPKLQVVTAADASEREADAVADRVMRAGEARGGAGAALGAHPVVVQRSASDAGVPVPGDVQPLVAGMRGSGQALPDATRSFFEQRFEADFSEVRVHTGGTAARAAKRLGAHAFTIGNDIGFAPGSFRPGSSAGDRLLAHELTHVLQQGSAGGQAAGVVQRDVPAGGDTAGQRAGGTPALARAGGHREVPRGSGRRRRQGSRAATTESIRGEVRALLRQERAVEA